MRPHGRQVAEPRLEHKQSAPRHKHLPEAILVQRELETV